MSNYSQQSHEMSIWRTSQGLKNVFSGHQGQVAGLEIISGESLDTMTGQIHFSSVTYRFWPVKLYKINIS